MRQRLWRRDWKPELMARRAQLGLIRSMDPSSRHAPTTEPSAYGRRIPRVSRRFSLPYISSSRKKKDNGVWLESQTSRAPLPLSQLRQSLPRMFIRFFPPLNQPSATLVAAGSKPPKCLKPAEQFAISLSRRRRLVCVWFVRLEWRRHSLASGSLSAILPGSTGHHLLRLASSSLRTRSTFILGASDLLGPGELVPAP